MLDKINEVIKKLSSINYGFVDKYNVIHKHSKLNYFKENYRYMSIDDTLKYNVGTCFEISALAKHLLKLSGIDSKIYMINYNDPLKLAKHTFTVVEDNGIFYWVDGVWLINEDNKFNSLEDLFNRIILKYPKMYKIEEFDKSKICVYEVNEETPNISFNEFVSNVKKGKRIM